MPKTIYIEIVAPDRRIFHGEARSIRAPGVEGSFEVLYNHAPMIAAFEIGPINVTMPSGDQIIFATSGGFLEVLNNTVTVLAETAEPASEIDIERAKKSEERALERLKTLTDPTEKAQAERALERARNRARITMGLVGSKQQV